MSDPTLPLIDGSYGKPRTYDLPGRCLTCGQRFTVRRCKGDKPPLSVDCPSCECTEYSWRDLNAILAQPAAPAEGLPCGCCLDGDGSLWTCGVHTPAAPAEGLAPHPGEHHDYRMTCTRCGEPGYLFVGFHSRGETFVWKEPTNG